MSQVKANITKACVYLPGADPLVFEAKQIAGVMPGILVINGDNPGSSVHYHAPFYVVMEPASVLVPDVRII